MVPGTSITIYMISLYLHKIALQEEQTNSEDQSMSISQNK